MIVTNRIKKYLIKAVLLLLFSATLAGCAVTYPEDAGVSEETPEKAAGKKSGVFLLHSGREVSTSRFPVRSPDAYLFYDVPCRSYVQVLSFCKP